MRATWPAFSFSLILSLNKMWSNIIRNIIRGPFEKFVDYRKCAAVIQREAVTVMPSCSGGGNVVVV
jgi:hypothetical protein